MKQKITVNLVEITDMLSVAAGNIHNAVKAERLILDCMKRLHETHATITFCDKCNKPISEKFEVTVSGKITGDYHLGCLIDVCKEAL